MNYIAGEARNVMKGNKRLEFLKSIRLPSEEIDNGRSRQVTQSKQFHNMTRQEEYEELFDTTSED